MLFKLLLVFLLVLNVRGEDLKELINEAKINDTKILQEQTQLLYQKKITSVLQKNFKNSLGQVEQYYNEKFNGTKEAADKAYKEYKEKMDGLYRKIKTNANEAQRKPAKPKPMPPKNGQPIPPYFLSTMWRHVEIKFPIQAERLAKAFEAISDVLGKGLPESFMKWQETTRDKAWEALEALQWWQWLIVFICILLPLDWNIPHELVLHPPQPPASSFVENRPGSPGSRGQRKLVASAPPLLDAPVEDDPPIPVHTDTEPHSESAVPIAEDQENLEKAIEEPENLNSSDTELPAGPAQIVSSEISPVPPSQHVLVVEEEPSTSENNPLPQTESLATPTETSKPSFLQSSLGLGRSTDELPESQAEIPSPESTTVVAPITPTSALPPLQPPFQNKSLLQEIQRPPSAAGSRFLAVPSTPTPTPTPHQPSTPTNFTPIPTVNNIPNPTPTPHTPNTMQSPEVHAESLSMKKNTLRSLRNLEPEEPEPQPPSIISPPTSARSRSTSIETDGQVSRRVRATRGSSSPPPVREAIYVKELRGSPLDSDAAGRPKREIEVSETFESELEAESQPGSDSERDDDLDY